MKHYIYCADVYCEACTRDIKNHFRKYGGRPVNYRDETTYDSDEYPKGPFSDEPCDSPQHCGSGEKCLDPLVIDGEKYGKFLEEPLTMQGEAYVREMHAESPSNITEMWMEFYDLGGDDDDDTE